nr:CBS domain-containing protein [Eubacterium sp.]
MVNRDKMIGKDNLSISEAMQKIDSNTYGILFLVDRDSRIVACITDGDIRRYLLSAGKMDEPALKAANHNPKCARDLNEAQEMYHRRNYVVVPVVDDNGCIIDFYAGDLEITEKKHSYLKVPVVINAGGRGTRLDPFTKVLPKPLIPVGELPIIELIMKEYQSYECNDFHIIVNYKKDLIKAYFHDNDIKYNITWYDEERPLGTGGGLSLLRGKMN